MGMLNVAIIGTGNIGCDLLKKITLSKNLKCTYFVGRNSNSAGIQYANKLGITTSSDGIDAIIKNINDCDIIFDATSAIDHIKHANLLNKFGKKIINLTPAKIGIDCVPAVNICDSLTENNLNLITCGGQASIPIIAAVKNTGCNLKYVEVVSSISSNSAGPATRINIHEYLEKTENSIRKFSGSPSAKAILNINPAIPYVNMQTTIYMMSDDYSSIKIIRSVKDFQERVKRYMPGYELVGDIQFEEEKITIMLRLIGSGHYLPPYAGNLDIITAAAVNIGEFLAINNMRKKYA